MTTWVRDGSIARFLDRRAGNGGRDYWVAGFAHRVVRPLTKRRGKSLAERIPGQCGGDRLCTIWLASPGLFLRHRYGVRQAAYGPARTPYRQGGSTTSFGLVSAGVAAGRAIRRLPTTTMMCRLLQRQRFMELDRAWFKARKAIAGRRRDSRVIAVVDLFPGSRHLIINARQSARGRG